MVRVLVAGVADQVFSNLERHVNILKMVPLLCAAALWLCPSDTVAVIVCLALAGCGMLGAGASILLISPLAHEGTQNHWAR